MLEHRYFKVSSIKLKLVKVCLIEIMVTERCTKPHVRTVVTSAKFHLSLLKANLFIVETVIESVEDNYFYFF